VKNMQKTKLLVISVLAAILLSSSVVSLAAAQEETPTASPNPDSIPPATPDPDSPVNDNSTVTDDTPILYGVGDNSTDANATDPIVPGAEDGELMYANGMANENTPAADNTWIVVAIGVILAIVVGGVIGVVYFHKQVAKAKN
jgi:hypothetical protein